MEARHERAFIEQMDIAQGILLSAQDQLRRGNIEDIYTPSLKENSAEIFKILKLSESKLRKTIRTKPEKELEIQDAFENLLIGGDLVYSREFPHIEYSSKQYIPDFSFADIDLAVEIKLCKEKKDEKLLIAQINDDILAYKTRFNIVLFIVYDLGVISDVDRFKDSFENQENVIVRIIKQ